MTQHVAPHQYSRAEISMHGLSCPFAKSAPQTYINIDTCKPTEGFKEVRLLLEHIWRKHTRFFRCDFCDARWSISTSRTEVTRKKEEHWKTCEGKRRNRLYLDGSKEDREELLNWKQQEHFEKVKSIRDIRSKLRALYEACGKPVPETYYAPGPLTAVQPQVNYGTVARTTTHRNQQIASHGGDFLAGFGATSEGIHLPRRRMTANNVSKANAVLRSGDNSKVSGANRPPDTDSGYSSMPGNNGGEADDRFPAQSSSAIYYWDQAPHSRSYAGSSHVSMASPGPITNGDEDFASVHGHVYHGCLQSYCEPDPLLYSSTTPARRDGSLLLGLTLPSPGAETAREPLDILEFTNLDAEFFEY